MDDSYREFVNDVIKSLNDLADIIFSLAQRTLSVKEFQEFAEEWREKVENKNSDDPEEFLHKKDGEV